MSWRPSLEGVPFWLPFSLTVHALGAYAFTPSPSQKVGSQWLDIELVAPRLAPPLLATPGPQELEGKRLGSPKSDATDGRKSVRRSPESQQKARQARRKVRKQRSPRLAKKASKGVSSQLLTMMGAIDPSRGAPRAMAAQLKQEAVDRVARRKRARRSSRRAEARVKRRLAELDQAARVHNRAAAARVRAGALDGMESARGERGVHLGRAAGSRYGLRFYLSGRPVATSRVVKPPVPKAHPTLRCQVARPGIPPATVRMLVSKDGDVPVAYIKRTSGSAAFDRCAVRYGKAMNFLPAEDRAGLSLNIWIHLRVEPGSKAL